MLRARPDSLAISTHSLISPSDFAISIAKALALLMVMVMVVVMACGLLLSPGSAWADGHEKHSGHRMAEKAAEGAKGATAAVGLPRSNRPANARVYFITPKAGAELSSPVLVRFGLGGMGVAPAGVAKDETGHHHLIVDAALPRMDLPVPNNDQYRHFGNGQTEVSLDLAPGQHTLQLLLADHLHIPHDPPVVSEQIKITVVDRAATGKSGKSKK